MDSNPFLSSPVLTLDHATGLLIIREAFGLDHERQVVTVECPDSLPPATTLFSFRDQATGVAFPAQRSQQNPRVAFVQLALSAGEEFRLAPDDTALEAQSQGVTLTTSTHPCAVVSNGKWSVELFLGAWKSDETTPFDFKAPTPIRRLRIKDGPWRGAMFFDTRQPVRRVTGTVLESGPLRTVTQFEARFGPSETYLARLIFDAVSDHVVIEETFAGGSGDQLVWDFSGGDLPGQIHLLDSSAGFTTQSLHYFFDRRLARLACWNQYSQLHDYSDGYALGFPKHDDVVGFVALQGGDWQGNAHNFLEAWTRRWFPGDPASRRLVPPEAKADAAPSPERIATRPANFCESHFSIEGWLHQGRRRFALVLTSKDALRPIDWNASPPLGPFETHPDRARYRQQQSLLRRIHIRRGMFPLAGQLALAPSWPEEKAPAPLSQTAPPWENPDHTYATSDQPRPTSIPERIDQMLQFLAARVYGFWEGSGPSYTNAVVSRRLAHDLLDWEWLEAHGRFTPAQSRQSRAWFLFLIELFSSDHYYPGKASMNLGDAGQCLEPTIAGMANQNFFTDIFNVPGLAAQVFPDHPRAAWWRDHFGQMWQRQLDYHVYPESGVWEESHTYCHHVLATILPTLERRLADGVEDGFAHPSFQRLAGALLKTLTPPDTFFAQKRHVVPLGDHGVDLNDLYRPLYRRLAHRLARVNPELSAQLAWAYREMGGNETLAVEPQPILWENEYVQGLGYFFRSKDTRGESLLVLRSGSAWGHHHNDEGSLHYYHAGRSWVVDSAFSYPQGDGVRKFRADGHSRWSPRDFAPLNYLWQFNRGWITHHGAEIRPCAVAFTPVYMAESPAQLYIPLRQPILHWRAVVQLTPSAFLVLDRSEVDLPHVVRLHVPASAPVALEDATPSSPAGTDGLHLRLRSLWGLHPAQWAAPDHPTRAPADFTTREIQFTGKGESVTAFLLSIEAGDTTSFSIIPQEANLLALSHSGFALAVDFRNPEVIRLIESKTGRGQNIPLSTPRV